MKIKATVGNAQKQVEIDDMLGAIARGWCSKENEKKAMDLDLAKAIHKEVMLQLFILLAQAKAEGALEVIGAIQYRLDGAKQDVEMAEDPADPKVRINYFESLLATLREDYQLKKEV